MGLFDRIWGLFGPPGVAHSAPDTYLGLFGRSVDQAYGDDKWVIATYAGWDEVEELIAWCKDNGCQCFWDRVLYDHWMCKWVSNGIGGADYLFIQCDSENSATMARLTWGI